jgi:hypothetical protein
MLRVYQFLTMYIISPALSFIMDPYDATYLQQGVFTEGELQEIKDYNAVVMDDLPNNVVNYLALFDCVSIKYV